MTKLEVQQRVLKNGKPLALDKFEWDAKTKTFSSSESGLVLDFRTISYCTIRTGGDCTLDTGLSCTLKTGYGCTLDTDNDCTIDTDNDCAIKTGSHCTIDTSRHCTIDTGSDCTINTGSDCTINTGSDCTIDTVSDCTISTGIDCVMVRSEIYEVIELNNVDMPIKTNGYGIKGYKSIKKHVITIDGKDIELSEESFNNLKEQLK